jgi:hypothetical protein
MNTTDVMAEDEEGGYVLKVGDFIMINHAGKGEIIGAALEARGILHGDEHAVFSKPTSVPENTIFQICVRTRVSAAQELQIYERQMDENPPSTPEEKAHQKAMLATLMRVNRKEQAMNEKLFEDEVGEPLKFGAVVQLKHVRSGKFLCCSDSINALSELENFCVSLVQNASELAWFTLMPAHAYDSVGHPVITGHKVKLVVTMLEEIFLHISRKEFVHPNLLLEEAHKEIRHDGDSCRELNASLDCSELNLSLFAPYTDNRTVVSVGDLIYLSNPNSKSYLRQSKNGGASAEEQAFEFAKFQKNVSDEILHVDAYFLVEASPDRGAAQRSKGGKIEWNEHVKLRHFNSGKYVQLVGGRLALCAAKAQKAANVCCVPARCARRGTDAKHVSVDCATTLHVRESHEGRVSATGSSFALTCDAAGVVSMQLDDGEVVADETPLLVHKESGERGLELLMAHDAQMVLLEMKKTLAAGTGPKVGDGDLSHSHIPRKTKKVLVLFGQLDGFIRCSNSTSYSTTRQQLLQEQGIVTTIIDIIELLNPLLKKTKTLNYQTNSLSSFGAIKSASSKVKKINDRRDRKALVDLLNGSFVMLQHCLVGYPDSQLFVANRFDVLLAYVDSEDANAAVDGDGEASGQPLMDCITTMLDNSEIQETKVEERTVDGFIDILRKPTPLSSNVMVLKLLSAFCICQGQAIRKNQNMLARSLLGAKKSGVSMVEDVVTTKATQAATNEAKTGTGRWVVSDPSEIQNKPGSNDVMVQFVPGTDASGTIKLVFPVAIKSADESAQRPMAIEELKEKGNEGYHRFLCYQLNLLAEMCYDRNDPVQDKVSRLQVQ